MLKTVHVEAAGRMPSGEDFKARFTETLIDRKVKICGLDEAVNAFKTGNSLNEEQRDRAVTDQSNRIKSLVNKSATTFVLVGAFDFYQLTVGTAQLARRSQIVHFKPYGSSPVHSRSGSSNSIRKAEFALSAGHNSAYFFVAKKLTF